MAKAKKPVTPKKSAKTKKEVKPLKASRKSASKDTSVEVYFQNIYKQLKLGESYVSLILGAVVVIVVIGAFFIFMSGRNIVENAMNRPSNPPTPTKHVQAERTYILKDGEGLWDVAVKFYGDGYKWTIISDANHLSDNPDNVVPGMKLMVPPLPTQ